MKAPRIWPFLLFLLLACIPFARASQTLDITVKTDKSTYIQGENVTISGKVMLDVTPHPNQLVALWVKNSSGSPMIPPITVQADEKGDFNFAFKLPLNAELGIYETYASSRMKNKNAIGHTAFRVEALTQSSNGEIPGDQRTLTLVMFIAFLVALGVIASAFVFLMLRRVKREPPAVPREDVDERYKKCVKCGRKILWFRTFCPYCYAYQSKTKTREEK